MCILLRGVARSTSLVLNCLYEHIIITMGRIGNSFQREIGKNAGKAVSNFIFGDSHSTPYRRVDQERKVSIAERKADAEIKRQERADLNLLDSAVLKNVDIVLQTTIPQNETEFANLMSIWSAQLENIKWSYWSKEGRIRNQFPNALLSKYRQCLLVLRSVNPSAPLLQYYKSIYIKARIRRALLMLVNPWVLLTLPLVVFLILGLCGVFD